MKNIHTISLAIILAPLIGCIISGLFRNQVGRVGAHRITIAGIAISFVLSLIVAKAYLLDGAQPYNGYIYTWASGGDYFPYTFGLGFLIDSLTAVMLLVVTFVSLLVHIYSIGYMSDDDGYQRFFSYISLFTFAMLMLVTANNFLQLFFGWEGVGLVSYLLIGFWYKKESASQGSLKAFLVNRVGDFGFILGIGLIFAFTGSIDYATVFSQSNTLAEQTISIFPNTSWSIVTVICILLFIGAMGKSAQVPLHVWLPESMEGPTPISALIHAATMVTAGVFMVARMSPLFELSTTALSMILIIGATGALFTGLIAIVMNDIKRVVAYSTLSQLGYMMVAMGASAYAAGIFHLATHAMFKAVLFLGAGSVIMAMHHEQDMRKMGGLAKRMPITYITFLIGALALTAIPPFAGYFSKDMIIESAKHTEIFGATYAFYCVAIGAFVTAVYTFRALFMTFHGNERMDEHTKSHIKESPWQVWVPLVGLAIPSIFLGYILFEPMLFAQPALLSNALFIIPSQDVLAKLAQDNHGPLALILHAVVSPYFWLATTGIFTAWIFYIWKPSWPELVSQRFKLFYNILMAKYGLDTFNDLIFIRGSRGLGKLFYKAGDQALIDRLFVNGSGLSIRWLALRTRVMQSGYLFHYTTVMVLALVGLLCWLML